MDGITNINVFDEDVLSIFPYRVKKDFAGVIKLRILAGEMILDYLGGPSVIPDSL